jgi:hypothetical protein
MAKNDFPASPQAAFEMTKSMASALNMQIPAFCKKAQVSQSSVYRWATNTRSYDVSVFAKARDYFNRARAAQKHRKAR